MRKLYEISKHIVDGPFGSAIKAEDYVEVGIPFIRVADVTHGDGTLSTDEMIYISEEAHQSIKRSVAWPGDVIVAKTGATMGAASVVPDEVAEANIRGDLALVGKLGSRLDADYLSAFINTGIGYKLFWRLNSGSTRGRVVISNLKKLPIIWPDATKRALVVDTITEGRRQRNTKLAQADALLASIDDYLLAELGITLPPEPENTIDKRMFRTKASDLGGWRFDPLFHSFKLWHAIEASATPSAHLGRYCRLAKTGFAAGGNMQLHDDDGVIQIRPTNIGSDRQLKFDRNVYLDQSILTEQPADVLQRREVLFNNTNSQEQVGKTAFFDIEGSFVCSNHITRIAINEVELLPEYLTAVLNAYQRLKVFYSICTNWNNQSGVNVDLLRKLTIPVPAIEKQRDIAREVRTIFDQANALRRDATDEMERAQADIEAILLGDAA